MPCIGLHWQWWGSCLYAAAACQAQRSQKAKICMCAVGGAEMAALLTVDVMNLLVRSLPKAGQCCTGQQRPQEQGSSCLVLCRQTEPCAQ